MFRAHQTQELGFKDFGGRCFTVFSAPNYCGTLGNAGAFTKIIFKKDKVFDIEVKIIEPGDERNRSYNRVVLPTFAERDLDIRGYKINLKQPLVKKHVVFHKMFNKDVLFMCGVEELTLKEDENAKKLNKIRKFLF
eukprot:UN28429